jgi:hypothetical protein
MMDIKVIFLVLCFFKSIEALVPAVNNYEMVVVTRDCELKESAFASNDSIVHLP